MLWQLSQKLLTKCAMHKIKQRTTETATTTVRKGTTTAKQTFNLWTGRTATTGGTLAPAAPSPSH